MLFAHLIEEIAVYPTWTLIKDVDLERIALAIGLDGDIPLTRMVNCLSIRVVIKSIEMIKPDIPLEYGCRPQGAVRYMGDGICNDMLNNKECLYDLGDCCLKFPALSTNNEYWYGPNIKCVEDSVDFETNIRIIGPLDPTKKFYDKVNRYIG